ncbi:TIGR00341 family protein [Pseudochryseolinea flava]|uniref:TIGR00341 family protein n=1 Tax=Pseudochryseolinea flava TaxID=2059302 RepID=A0A364Y5B7_9BACT|nr:TIGR00341 family protein [Pseudochryseolinea flava]RAW01551.1 TIGR00341 family protein [Pseudochryseolinea flava]
MVKKLLRFLDVKSDLDNVDEIHKTIRDGIIFKGTNLWILVFAIIIASVGLNTNSTAVIIGAMLISPLMGPINGMGYSIATYDFTLFRRALKNFLFAVGASLAASTLYFLVTPISTAHSELLARTSPTIYDVLIALFGGLAGILAISSRHKGNVIPGVAIATALMPPLCTAGFGLATGQFTFFFGAFYLFTINTVFIGISSVLFSQFLSFPIRTLVENSHKRKVNRWITAVIVVTIVPSLYFGYLLVEKERFSEKASRFINTIGAVDGSYLLRHKVNVKNQEIKLVYGGNTLSDKGKSSILERASLQGLDSTQLVFEQGFSFSEVNRGISQVDNTLRGELNRINALLQKSESRQDSIRSIPLEGKQILRELQNLYPEVSSLALSHSIEYFTKKDSAVIKFDSTKIMVVNLSSRIDLREADKSKIKSWLKARLHTSREVRLIANEK